MPGLKARCFWGGVRCFGGSAGAEKVGSRLEKVRKGWGFCFGQSLGERVGVGVEGDGGGA